MSKKTSNLCVFEVAQAFRKKAAKIGQLREENKRLRGLIRDLVENASRSRLFLGGGEKDEIIVDIDDIHALEKELGDE